MHTENLQDLVMMYDTKRYIIQHFGEKNCDKQLTPKIGGYYYGKCPKLPKYLK